MQNSDFTRDTSYSGTLYPSTYLEDRRSVRRTSIPVNVFDNTASNEVNWFRAGERVHGFNSTGGAMEIAWTPSRASDVVRDVHLALAAGAHLRAREISAAGAKSYPDHSGLQKMARVLAPPKIVKKKLPPDASVEKNRQWLSEHAEEYMGQWVALKDGEVLASAEALGELKQSMGAIRGVTVIKVT